MIIHHMQKEDSLLVIQDISVIFNISSSRHLAAEQRSVGVRHVSERHSVCYYIRLQCQCVKMVSIYVVYCNEAHVKNA